MVTASPQKFTTIPLKMTIAGRTRTAIDRMARCFDISRMQYGFNGIREKGAFYHTAHLLTTS